MREIVRNLQIGAAAGMTPLERACVLLVLGLCLTLAMVFSDGLEQWLGVVLGTMAFAGSGLISGASAVWRIAIGGSVIAALDHVDDMLKRPAEAFTVAAFGAEMVSGALGAFLLPYFDPPASLRAWAFPHNSRVLWRAGLYYAFYSIVTFVLFMTMTMVLLLFGLGSKRLVSSDGAVAAIAISIMALSIYSGWGSWRSRLLDVKSGRRDGWVALLVRSLARSGVWVGGCVVTIWAYAALMAWVGAKEDLFAGTALSEFGGFIKEWRAAPVWTALEGLLAAAVFALLATPVTMGLEGLSHRALSPARRSGLVAALKTLAIVLGCGAFGGMLGMIFGAAGGNELSAAARANGIGLALGLSVGVLVVLWRMRRSRRLATPTAGPVVPAAGSGGASLPAGIADVVKRIGQQ